MNPHALEVDKTNTDCLKEVTKRKNMIGNDAVNEKQLVLNSLESMENKIQKIADMLTYLELKLDQFRASSYNPHWAEVRGLEFVLNSTNRISLADKFGVFKVAHIRLKNDFLANARMASSR